MPQQTGVDWPTCEQEGCIGIRLAGGRMCLEHCGREEEGEKASVFKQVGETGVIDARGMTITDELLRQILTAVRDGAGGKLLIKGCRFDRATFEGDARFDGATFSGPVWFDGAAFNGDARFGGAVFSGDAQFGGAVFKATADFGGVRFEHARRFGPVLAHRGLVLDEAQFMQPVQVEVSTIGLSCRGVRFADVADLRVRWAQVVLEYADFSAPSILTFLPGLEGENLARQEQQAVRDWRGQLGDKISERPQLLSLRRAKVADLELRYVNAADCRFAGAYYLDKLRMGSSVTFATAPGLLSRLGVDWRQVIAEECAWRAGQSRVWDAPLPLQYWADRMDWPGSVPRSRDWAEDQRQLRELEPGQIAGLYRTLRKGREDAKDEPDAADFYYGEMEMRRHARPLSGRNRDDQSGEISRGRVERTILTVYWLVSGYGLRAWRAVACLVAVTATLAFAFHFAGFTVPPRPVSYWTSLLYAFRATLSLTDSDVQLTAWGQLLQAVLRLTGPVLLGLALLALRGRIRR